MVESTTTATITTDLLEGRVEELEAALEKKQAELLQSSKMATIGHLAAGVAHEINNPLGFVMSNLTSLGKYLESLLEVLSRHEGLARDLEGHDELSDRIAEVRALWEEKRLEMICEDVPLLIGECTDGLERMQRIVRDLRDFSHVDPATTSEEDINDLLDRSTNIAAHELKYKAEVKREYGEIPRVACYGMQLAQCFLNLLVNAAQAIPKFGTIIIRTAVAGDDIVIEIEDTGEGIPEDSLESIFEPYFTTKDVGKGTGLGLPMVKKTIEEHGGEITVESVVGEGSLFRVTIPKTPPTEPAPEQQ